MPFSLIHVTARASRLFRLMAALVLLTLAGLQAGHVHNTLVEKDPHCVLCHVGVALDEVIPTSASLQLPLALTIFESLPVTQTSLQREGFCPPIRAPPR